MSFLLFVVFFYRFGSQRDLHVRTHSFPTRRSSDLISQAARDYVTTIANPRAVNEQWVVTASVSGELFDIWGGGVGYALGYEHRDEKARFDPGTFYYGLPDPNDPTGDRDRKSTRLNSSH